MEKSASSFMAEPRVSDSLSARTGRGDYALVAAVRSDHDECLLMNGSTESRSRSTKLKTEPPGRYVRGDLRAERANRSSILVVVRWLRERLSRSVAVDPRSAQMSRLAQCGHPLRHRHIPQPPALRHRHVALPLGTGDGLCE